MITKRSALYAIVVAFSTLTVAAPLAAETYPNRPVKFIVPYPAGGSTDVAGRVIAQYLSRDFNQQVYVENRSGANGTIGIEAASKSTPDGYTVLIGSVDVANNPHVYKTNVDPTRDLVPVIQLSRQPIVLAAHPSLGVNSLAELVSLAGQQPGLRYGTGSGLGSPQHIAVQWFAGFAGIKLQQVPYRGGAPALNDLVAGHVKIASLGSTPLMPYYRAGSLRLLVQSTQMRAPSLPDVPTFQEAGINGLVLDQWMGVFVPAGTPPTITARLNSEIGKALADPQVRENFLQSALEPVGGTAEQFAHLVHEDFARYERLVKELDVKLD
jgi:tripartite-type tricarboxylate transporter receptor subunit TctC